MQNFKFAAGVQIMQVSETELALKVSKNIYCALWNGHWKCTHIFSQLDIFLGVEKNIGIAWLEASYPIKTNMRWQNPAKEDIS